MKLKKINHSYSIITDNGKEVGNLQLDIDGSYYFWETSKLTGCWTAHTLREIATLLDEVNKPHNEEVVDHFRKDFEERARVEYRQLLNESGMFFEFYPKLTGDWKKDKEEWFIKFKKLEELRQQVKAKWEL